MSPLIYYASGVLSASSPLLAQEDPYDPDFNAFEDNKPFHDKRKGPSPVLEKAELRDKVERCVNTPPPLVNTPPPLVNTPPPLVNPPPPP
eukprot:6284280-Pyramimonas_sp.AAC.1